MWRKIAIAILIAGLSWASSTQIKFKGFLPFLHFSSKYAGSILKGQEVWEESLVGIFEELQKQEEGGLSPWKAGLELDVFPWENKGFILGYNFNIFSSNATYTYTIPQETATVQYQDQYEFTPRIKEYLFGPCLQTEFHSIPLLIGIGLSYADFRLTTSHTMNSSFSSEEEESSIWRRVLTVEKGKGPGGFLLLSLSYPFAGSETRFVVGGDFQLSYYPRFTSSRCEIREDSSGRSTTECVEGEFYHYKLKVFDKWIPQMGTLYDPAASPGMKDFSKAFLFMNISFHIGVMF